MIDRIRYFLGVLNLIVLPAGLFFWFVIHPWARWWRRLGPIRTYLIVLSVALAFGALLFRFRGLLLAADFGTNWGLVVIYSASSMVGAVIGARLMTFVPGPVLRRMFGFFLLFVSLRMILS